MANPVPNALALTTINDGAEIIASDHRNNYSALQSFGNLLRACLAGGTSGQVLQAVDGTDVQYVVPKGVLASGTKTSNVTSTGTTFGTGADLLAAALSFTADGTSNYLLRVYARAWTNSLTTAASQLNLNLDGVDKGQFASMQPSVANVAIPLSVGGVILVPTAGAHTVNARLSVSVASTATVVGGAGGAGVDLPIFVSVEKL